jgi:hypothetical protein
VDEDMSKTQKNMESMKKAGFHWVDLDDVIELLNLHREELSTEALVQLMKHQEEKKGTAEFEVVHMLTSNRSAQAF